MLDRADSAAPRARQVRIAETIAAELRERILNGTLPQGTLPKQDELIAMFGVSGPSLREALRILEVEGLVTVRRGKVGGAEIHRPNGSSAAYAVGLTLQGERSTVNDLASALLMFEPNCAAIVAESEEREELGAALEKNIANTEAALGDGAAFTHLSREFHELIVDAVPNRAIRLLVRSLESVWSAQEETWANEATRLGDYPILERQNASLEAHRHIAANIRMGNAGTVERAARKHLNAAQELVLQQYGDRVIDATSSRAVEGFRRIRSNPRIL